MVSKVKQSPLIVILGETASGKSAIAIELAKKFKGEIINADSWAVYKGFNIGTAKPSEKDQKSIKHHLIDIAEPKEGFNAAIFKKLVSDKIEDITTRGKVPILSGGTGLYIDSVLYDYGFLPGSTKKKRKKYNDMTLDELRDIVTKLKYKTEGIDLNNKRRIIRLIENEGARPSANGLRQDTLIIGIKIEPEKLKSNIENRVNEMLEAGLENEVKELSQTYGWDIEPMKGIGYREFRKQFEGSQTIEQTKELIIIHSMQLAKKQRSWFGRNNSIHWLSNKSKIVATVTTYLNKLSD
jgi:tRNA dimethylallyltransferase